MLPINTSYAREYVVVSKDADGVVLRVTDEALYRTYWQEFISADVIEPAYTDLMYLRIEQAPPQCSLIDQYSYYFAEIPLVTLLIGEKAYNVTDRVTANNINTEIPGLYRVDYFLTLGGRNTAPFWHAFVSVQQKPILRRAAAGWVRDNYIVKTLNRLVLEPQFIEAMHNAGKPLYNFMEANEHQSIPVMQLPKYQGLRVWGTSETADGNASVVFISGPQLLEGTILVYSGFPLKLRGPVYLDSESTEITMNDEHQLEAADAKKYKCKKKGSKNYIYAGADGWVEGYCYRYTSFYDGDVAIPIGEIITAAGQLQHLWAPVDDYGYPLWVDLLRISNLGMYRGHYDPKSLSDYAPYDLVSYVSENSIALYRRKPTSIPYIEEELYPPGHYRNTSWEEVYRFFEGDDQPLLSNHIVIPHTNAMNAVVAQTGCVSEEMCWAYCLMMGVPESIIKACGAKMTASLLALLVRTRNTPGGLKLCLRAVGFDIDELHLSEPSTAYYVNGSDEPTTDVYAQLKALKELSKNITSLAPAKEAAEKDGNLRYIETDDTIIQQYNAGSGEWVTKYQFARIEPSQNYNNMYYDGSLTMLARLAEDAVVKLNETQYIRASAYAGDFSAVINDVLRYEIPIYIYLRLHIYLIDVGHLGIIGAPYQKVSSTYFTGAQNIIELFPTLVFSRAAKTFELVPTGVFRNVDGVLKEVTPVKSDDVSKIYIFDNVEYGLHIRAYNTVDYSFDRYWLSRNTCGLLGSAASDSTENFIDATDLSINDTTDLMLANGYVGVTAYYKTKRELYIAQTTALRWMYILNDSTDEETWQLSESECFCGWERADIGAIIEQPYFGTVADLINELAAIEDANGNSVSFNWAGGVLILQNAIPEYIYLKNAAGAAIGIIKLGPNTYTLTATDLKDIMEPTDTVKILFTDVPST